MSQRLTKQLLLSSNYWVLNKEVVKLFGIETAFFLSNLAEAENLMSDKNGWFYQTTDTVEKITTLSRHKQNECIKRLEKANILEKNVRGMPARRFFRIDYKALSNLIVKNSQTRVKNFYNQDCEKSAGNKESSYKESNKESISYNDVEYMFQDNGFGLLGPTTREILVHLTGIYSNEWVYEAMERSIRQNVRKIQYVEAILKDWQVNGKNNNPKKQDNDPYAGVEVY